MRLLDLGGPFLALGMFDVALFLNSMLLIFDGWMAVLIICRIVCLEQNKSVNFPFYLEKTTVGPYSDLCVSFKVNITCSKCKSVLSTDYE